MAGPFTNPHEQIYCAEIRSGWGFLCLITGVNIKKRENAILVLHDNCQILVLLKHILA